MSNTKKTYFLAPNFHILPPPTGPLLLGSIISSVSKPEHILNRQPNYVPIPPSSPSFTHHQAGFSSTHSNSLSGSFGGFTALNAFLSSILSLRVDADLDGASSGSTIYKCKDLETTYFYPDDEYIAKNIEIKRVKDWMTDTYWKKPVYMITGLKIARGMKAESKQGKSLKGKVEVGVDATMLTGVPVSGGPKVGGGVEAKNGVSWDGSDDFIFAYRVVRIKLKGKEGGFEAGEHISGALYSEGDEGAKGNLRDEWDVSEIEDMEGEEIVAPHIICEEEPVEG
ncbi:uncharacterized protein LY89DRAFT_685729 [Mollisia scopiformis]|uniref:Uncharacterized protein n=1 Tax=Mollisia scopiformis TaxID=149040 RepID=A0A194X6J2_MOLSC|nr:uncharacterized protein LY89DRAFT_685729 [Mollisia scopiformis]KUJ15790.1 hypothetical protein LY89DRAFT_685729 [Mollisia scopiformis]